MAIKPLLTAEEFFDLPDDGCKYELLDGELITLVPPGGVHGKVITNFAIAIGVFVRKHGLGEVMSGDVSYVLRRRPDRVRAPDLSFVAHERVPPGGLPAGLMQVIPDLVVEVISPSDRAGAVEQKTQEWLSAGVRLVLLAYPESRTIVAWRGGESSQRYMDSDTFDFAPVLPDLRVEVAEFFS